METPRMIAVSTGTILKVLAILLAGWLAWELRDILLYTFSAILLAGVMYPLARWAERHRVPKGLTVAVVYIVLIGLLITAISFLVPALRDQTRLAAENFGSTLGWLQDATGVLRDVASRIGIQAGIPPTISGVASQAQDVALGVIDTLGMVAGGVAGVIIVIVLSFYIVIEDEAAKKAFRSLVPEQYQEFASRLVWQVMEKLGDWMRGQLALSASISTAYFIAFTVIGVPYPLLLALVAGLFEFVPYIGPILAAGVAIFIAFTVAPWMAVVVAIVVLVVQQLQNNIVAPMVMRRAVGLNPVVSILAFLVGYKLFGAPGAIFAIPVATACSVAATEYVRFRNGT
ncbi:AI-2E family transporter [Candidatus Uhrbacteria bacterium]|nr:AI-2E family transporter [Candidatus Uhrbacteria bacterium]